jgi:hypothetical protein
MRPPALPQPGHVSVRSSGGEPGYAAHTLRDRLLPYHELGWGARTIDMNTANAHLANYSAISAFFALAGSQH